MAEVQDCNNLSRIKLFGATISLLERQSTIHDPTPDDQTVERRPHKIIIPCPRCKSMETKFCYFNNYNVNQPRHLCKGCQRYWTAGVALRNVPVGSGRRKMSRPPGHHLGGSSEGCLLDASLEVQQFDQFNPVEVEEWQVEDCLLWSPFPAKRRRNI